MPTLNFSRNPDLGDTQSTDYKLLKRRGLSNEIITFKSDFWKPLETLRLSISALEEEEVEQVIEFLQTYAGQEVTLIDYDSVIWTGIVIDDPVVEQVGRGCNFKMTFSFEGTFVLP